MKKLLFLLFLIVSPFISMGVNAQENPVVLELFTSQSCSSCPPADRLLGKLNAENPNIIALSCHVTYWNHLHWKDTLSQQFCTDRQRQYVRSLRARGSYTPQIVINGQHELVGSREGQIRRIMSHELNQQSVQPIALKINDKILTIDLSSVKTVGRDLYYITLFPYGNNHHQKIKSGENRGRTVTYTSPVQSIVSSEKWNGQKDIIKDVSNVTNAQGLAVLVQKGSPAGEITAAGKIKF